METHVSLNLERPLELIGQCPAYAATPIVEIPHASGRSILVKDETGRFDLGAFKALGGIYAVASFLLEQWRAEHNEALIPAALFDTECKDWSNRFTFVCASAGNHGVAVAKGAQLFNANCRVFLAESVPQVFAERLMGLGAVVVRAGATYEESMAAAQADCAAQGSANTLLADSSWPGYTALPTRVMEGYTVMAEEMRKQFLRDCKWPTHVFLQAGVGGLAAAVAYHIRHRWQEQPRIVVVEPEAAPCLTESNRRGKLTSVSGPTSSMGRLDCKEPSMLAFDILQTTANEFVCVSEAHALAAVNYLADHNIGSTPSGAAGLAALLFADDLGLAMAENAQCLVIATEGVV